MDGIDLMADAMRAAQVRLNVSASNLANVSSDGFKRSASRTLLSEAGLTTSVHLDASPGPLRRTGRPLDVSIAGAGSFFVAGAAGKPEAIRSASLVRTADGTLRDGRGRAVIGEQGVLHVPPGSTVDQDGVVRCAGSPAGRLRLTPSASVAAGFLETANVNAIREMVDVLSSQRAFETAEQTLSALDGARSKAVNDVARVKS
jgi:flagellar basal body rod protein FlgG